MPMEAEVGKFLRYRLRGYVPWSLAMLALVLLLFTGCVTPIAGAKKDLLEFLPGHTTREEVLTTLGQPSGVFEQEKILTYRLGHDENQGYYIISQGNLCAGSRFATAWSWCLTPTACCANIPWWM
jgi:hypothetical protein